MSKRAKVEQYILGLMKVADMNSKDKPNLTRYQQLFKSMDDKAFDKWMRLIRDGKEQIHIYAPNLKNGIDSDVANAMCEYTKTLIYEQVQFTDELTGRKYYPPNKFLVLPLPVRRLKQFIMDKMRIPEGDTKRDLLSGQVIKPDKGSSVSLVEMQSIVDKGLEDSVVEFIKIRGGDNHAYSEALSNINAKGEFSLDELDLKSSVPRSAVVADVLIKGMHIDNNIVEGG